MSERKPRVVLVHGLLNADWWLRPLAARLRAEGFETALFGYSSVRDGPLQRALPPLRQSPVDGLLGQLWVSVWPENLGAQCFCGRHGFAFAGEFEFIVGERRDREFMYRRVPRPVHQSLSGGAPG